MKTSKKKRKTYFDTLNGANDMSAEPLTKSPIIPFHWSSAQKQNTQLVGGREWQRSKHTYA